MFYISLLSSLLFCLLFSSVHSLCPVKQVAIYNVTFIGEWTAESQVDTGYPNFPPCGSSPFFGNLIGATHNSSQTHYVWENAGYATPGFADYVDGHYNGYELREEIVKQINNGYFGSLIFIPQTLPLTGTESTIFHINYTTPFVDVVVSIVPSPDWFVGVSKLPLFEQGHWYKFIAIDLYAWDAGTQVGTDFYTSNVAQNPQLRISSLRNKYPFGPKQKPLGVLIFERVDSDNCVLAGDSFYSWQLKELVSVTQGASSCFKPIPGVPFIPATEIPSQGYVLGTPSFP